MLQRVLPEHLQTFLAQVDADETRRGLPGFVRRELYRYLHDRVGIGIPESSDSSL